MEQIISSSESARLTGAIEKAATLASLHDDQDRSQILADQLKQANIEPKFAKVASDAFNKRLTVVTFRKTADEHRAEPFPLADADKVRSLMGGEEEQQSKAASLGRAEFKFNFESAQPPIQKAASVTHMKPLYEDTVDYHTFQDHLDSMLEKHAARISVLTGMVESLDSKIKMETEQLANYFNKTACASYEFTTLKNYFGNRFEAAFKDALPEHVDFSKTASAAILPDKDVYRKTAALLKERQALQDMKDFMAEYGKGLYEFSKTAAAYGDFIQMCEFDGIHKTAATSFAAQAMRGGALMGLTTVQALEAARRAGQDASNTGFNNARNLYNAGTDNSVAPNSILDADFLVKDRYRDRMMGWSDMSADPQFSMYPAEQVFQATNKAMDTDSSLERADRRELLRAQVGQLLAQNNRSSTADIASLATTLKALTSTGGPGANLAAKPVNDMDKVKAPDPVELGHVTDAIPANSPFLAKDYISSYGNMMESARAQEQKEEEAEISQALRAREKEEDRRQAELKDAQERYRSQQEKEQGKRQAAKQKAVESVLKERNLVFDPSQQLYIDTLGRTFTVEQVAQAASSKLENDPVGKVLGAMDGNTSIQEA